MKSVASTPLTLSVNVAVNVTLVALVSGPAGVVRLIDCTVGRVHSADALAERDRIGDAGGVGVRAGRGRARDRLHGGRRLVDAVDLASEAAVARAGAAQQVAGGVLDGIVVHQVQSQRAVTAD